MTIDAISLYDDFKDEANKWESGYASIDMFNRLSRLAELRVIDWLSGDVAGQQPPEPWLTQKNKDFLSHLITKYPANVTNGVIERPADYYRYDNFYRIGTKVESDCDEEATQAEDDCDTPIEMLDGDEFNQRCNTYVKDKKPSFKKPICKMVGNEIEVRPRDLGSVQLEYIRYPKFAIIGKKKDEVYNDEVPDDNNTTNYEWPEAMRGVILFFIVDMFSNHIREQALKQFNAATGKSVRA